MLDEVVRYLVEVASVLPRSETVVEKESLTRLSHLGSDVAEVLTTVRQFEARVVKPGAGRDARFEFDYRTAVVRELDRVELFGADIPPENQRNLLSDAFVTLSVDRRWKREEAEAGRDAAKNPSPQSGVLTCNELFDSLAPESPSILIRGSAGSGKTTLLRWASLEAAGTLAKGEQRVTEHFRETGKGRHIDATIEWKTIRGTFETRRQLTAHTHVDPGSDAEPEFEIEDPWVKVFQNWRRRIPFFIPLRNCQSGQLPAADELPQMIATSVGKPPQSWVQGVLDDGRAIVMLDGVDEVPAQNRERLREEIREIVEAYPECYFVLTSRPTAVADEWNDWLDELKFRRADVSPMSLQDVERFVGTWYSATAKELGRQGRPDPGLAEQARRLVEQFQQNPPLSLLATNPLLCAMICALHRVRHEKLPESQYELCETLCHMLLHKRERESHLNWQAFPEEYIALKYEQKRGIAQQLAQWLMEKGQSAMPVEVAYEQVAAALQRIPGRNADEAPLILKTLIERSGLLREPNPDVVDFLHNTFKELLAGDEIAARGVAETVLEHLDDESWRRVGLFAVASPRSQTFASDLITGLLEPLPRHKNGKIDRKKVRAACREDKSLLQTVLFILQCRKVAAFLDPPSLSDQVDRLIDVPYPPGDFEAAEAIARLGDDAIAPLLAVKKLDDAEPAATARALRLMNSQASRDALRKKFIDSEDWDVIAEVAQTMNPLSIPLIVSAIQSEVWHSGDVPDSVKKSITDVSPLASLTDIQTLYLTGTGVSDVSALASLTSLQILSLNRTAVSDVSPLASLTSLQTLYLNRTAVRDVSPLASLTSLQTLYLDETGVSDIRPLASVTSLRNLHLNRTGVSDVSPLASLPSLRILMLDRTGVSDLTPLAACKNLIRLDCDGTGVSDVGPLAALTDLETLFLVETGVSDVRPLASLTSLQTLYLNKTGVSDVSPLASLTSLETLSLVETGVSDVSLLASLASLQALYLTDTGVRDVSALASLDNLRIHGLDEIQTAGPEESPDAAESDADVAVSRRFQLSRLNIENWRGFVRREFDFAHEVTVLIGNNGTGKSSTLEALAAGLATWTGAFHESAERLQSDADVHRKLIRPRGSDSDQPPQMEPQFDRFFVEWDATFGTESWHCKRAWTGATSEVSPVGNVWGLARKVVKQVQDGNQPLLPLMAYYCLPRRSVDVQLAPGDLLPPFSSRDGYQNCLAPLADVKELKRLLRTRAIRERETQEKSPDALAIEQAVLTCLAETKFPDPSLLEKDAGEEDQPQSSDTSICSFGWDSQRDELMIGFEDGRRLEFGLLSDGQRTTIALVADIARRAATLNPQLGAEAAKECPGIVLVDEIELHLHPRWQRTIVNDLRRTFPLLQFVLTTHSALIIQSCRTEEVINLDPEPDNPQSHRDYTEMSPEDILEYVQGLDDSPRSQRMLAMREAAENYYTALREADSVSDEEREKLKARLEELEEPFTDDPGFYAFLRLERAAAGLKGDQ